MLRPDTIASVIPISTELQRGSVVRDLRASLLAASSGTYMSPIQNRGTMRR
jgi:hypothetical protein